MSSPAFLPLSSALVSPPQLLIVRPCRYSGSSCIVPQRHSEERGLRGTLFFCPPVSCLNGSSLLEVRSLVFVRAAAHRNGRVGHFATMRRGRRPCGQLHSNQRIRCICTDQVREARNFHDKEIQQPGRQVPNIAPADQIVETPIDALSFADDSMQSTVSTHVESLKPASQQTHQRDEAKDSRLGNVFYVSPFAPFRVMKSMRPAERWLSRGFAAEPSFLTVM